MSKFKQIEAILLFDDIKVLGRLGEIVNQISSNITIEKFFNPQQIQSFKFDQSTKKYLLITEGQFLNAIGEFDLSAEIFEKIFYIDKEEKITNLKAEFLNPKEMPSILDAKLNDIIISNSSSTGFVPVSVNKLTTGVSYPCEFFLEVNGKYIKITSKNDVLDESTITKFINKKVDIFYIEKSEYENFLKVLPEKKTVFKKSTDTTNVAINALESLHNYTKELGIDPVIIEKAKALQNEIEKHATNKAMKGLFNKLKNLQGSFLYNHSYVCATIALTVGKKFSWFTYENQEKIYMGSMFHDLGYQDEKNAIHEHLSLEEIKNLPKRQQEDILNHTTKYAQVFSSMPSIHQDVINIMVRHHGVHSDNSYPKKIQQMEVTLIFALFAISHEFTILFFNCAFNKQKVPEILEILEQKFNKGNYKSILPEFKSSIIECFSTN